MNFDENSIAEPKKEKNMNSKKVLTKHKLPQSQLHFVFIFF
jgi:hypothetical protein